MKQIAALMFVFSLILLTASCTSSPNWSGAETASGEFVWSPSPGIRLYVNIVVVVLLLSIPAFGGVGMWKNHPEISRSGVVFGFAFLLLLLGITLYGNLRGYIWAESFSMNSERIEHTFYPTIWKAEKETLEWKNVATFDYFPNKSFRSESFIYVFRSTGEPAGGGGEEGVSGRAISLAAKDDRKIELALEKTSYDTGKDSLSFLSWIFGSRDFNVAPEEEKRLKTAINKYLSERRKQEMSQETKEYLSKQE